MLSSTARPSAQHAHTKVTAPIPEHISAACLSLKATFQLLISAN